MTDSIDLDAYFERIKWGGATTPTYETLAGLLGAQMAQIPFEALDVLLGRGVSLELGALQDKLVRRRRGGYCFEHSTLLAAALEKLGFDIARHTARVLTIRPRNESPRTHMVLTAALPEGRFVLDPGLGGLAPRVPVPLVEDQQVRAGHELHWFGRDDDHWVLRAQAGERVVDCWASPFDADNLIDFEVGNHFTATHPESGFRNRLMLRALTPTGRITVVNRDVTTWEDNLPRPGQLADRGALRALLRGHFGFDLPEIEDLRVPQIPEWT